MKLVSGINTSGIFSHSGLSAEIATKDSLGNVIKDTYLSAVPDGYLTKSSADTLYQPIGNYASDSDLSYVSGKVDSVSSELSGAIDNKLDTSSYHEYSAGNNIDITDYEISGKDWTTDISNASSYAYNQATAQIPSEFDPTYMSGQIDNKLNKSESANYYPSTANPSGYLVPNDITALANKSDLTYVSGKVDSVSSELSGVIDTNSAVFSGAIDYISGQIPTAFGDMLESNLDSETHWDSESNEFNVLTGYNGSSFGIGSFYITDNDEIQKDDGDAIISINSTGIRFSNPDGGYSNQSGDYCGGYWSIGSDNSSARLVGWSNFYGSPIITFIDNNNDTAEITMSSISAWNEVSSKLTKSSADTLYQPSGTYLVPNDITACLSANLFEYDSSDKITAYNGSAFAGQGGGGSIDTLPFFVQEPLTTGISGSSAYIALTGGTDNSAYIPYSAIAYYFWGDVGYINSINDSAIYANRSFTSDYADTARYDVYGNEITEYYQPTLTFGISDNTITSINNTAVGGGGTPTATLELSAGNYITITDDTANSASILSVSGLATTTEINYVSGVIGDVETLLASL